SVKRRRAVKQNRSLFDYVVEDVPHLWARSFHNTLGGLDVVSEPARDQAVHDERLEQLQRHALGQTALVQLQLGTDDDHRPPGVVHALAEQVLAEAALLALEHVRERLQLMVACRRDSASAPAVIDQAIDGLLKHPLLVADDDLWRTQLEEPLQSVIPVDHAAVEVVEIARSEA